MQGLGEGSKSKSKKEKTEWKERGGGGMKYRGRRNTPYIRDGNMVAVIVTKCAIIYICQII